MADKLKIDDDYDEMYEPSDSEDNYSEEEKDLLKQVREGNRRKKDPKQEVLAFAESDDEDEDDDDNDPEQMDDSDIEGAGDNDDADIPDSRAWGKKARDYYNTDFVDPDYSTYTEKELQMAEQEEEEALAIQRRLAQQMNEADFTFDIPTTNEGDRETLHDDDVGAEKSKSTTELSSDLSSLSKRQKLQLFEKDSPEFAGLVEDLLLGLNESSSLLTPVLEYAKEHALPRIPALSFAQLMNTLLTSYCSNINFYLMLKAQRVPIKNHPIAKRLIQLKNLLEQLSDRYENIIKPQLEALLERIEDGDIFEVLVDHPVKDSVVKGRNVSGDGTKKKTMLDVANATESDEELKLRYSDDEGTTENDSDQETPKDEDDRRGITYQIAKNKGLTPHRKKELRNPRVKHRSKFRKAIIRRKGAVRTVRKETKRYGGEISGIKATVSKSIKFK